MDLGEVGNGQPEPVPSALHRMHRGGLTRPKYEKTSPAEAGLVPPVKLSAPPTGGQVRQASEVLHECTFGGRPGS